MLWKTGVNRVNASRAVLPGTSLTGRTKKSKLKLEPVIIPSGSNFFRRKRQEIGLIMSKKP